MIVTRNLAYPPALAIILGRLDAFGHARAIARLQPHAVRGDVVSDATLPI